MSIVIVPKHKLNKNNVNILTEIIYKNFIELSQYKHLKHTRKDIHDLLLSDNSVIMLYMIDKSIGGYLVGEIMTIDSRRVFYITYIFTSVKFRNKGIASQLINNVENIVDKKDLSGILLTCDTENKNIYDFYLKKGFMPDLVLRNYSRFDVLYK